MEDVSISKVKLGILGGGQLGKMLLQATSCFDIETFVLEPNEKGPAAHLCNHFIQGDFTNYDDVYAFGSKVDVITIEIENVNVKALKDLKALGKTVNPAPELIELIQDKGSQKSFYLDHNLPTANFSFYNSAEEIKKDIDSGKLKIPFIQKLRKEGYDGKGVLVVNKESKLDQLFEKPSIVEDMVSIDKELAVIVARNSSGETKTFPSVEMEFNPEANLVEFLFAPANIDSQIEAKAQELAIKLANDFDLNGILAIELFLSNSGELLINEVAPRPHNSGHHTIEANITSQYEQHMRAILNLPLGSTSTIMSAVMVNLLGEPGYTGDVVYKGLNDVLKTEGTKLHIYGKKVTKPFRKMGHVTILDKELSKAIEKAKFVKQTLKIIA